VLKVLKDHKVL
jgi:hypothetical protein